MARPRPRRIPKGARYLLGRIIASVVLLFVASVVVFTLQQLAPGSPESILLGGRPSTPALLESIRERYHLDEPVVVQFFLWFGGVLTGDLGDSILYKTSVAEVIGNRMEITLQLGLMAALITIVLGLVLGFLMALKKGSVVDSVSSSIAVFLASTSAYVSGMILLLVFAVGLRWFPIYGAGDAGLDRLYHLLLPAIALALPLVALLARTTRATVIEVLELEFVEAAYAKGQSRATILFKHIVRNSLIPILTVAGLIVGYLIAGTVLVEYTFGLNGLGTLLVGSVQSSDYAVVQAIALLLTAVFVFANLVVDLLYFAVDPRVRFSRAE